MCASTVPSRAVIHEWLQPIAFFILLLLPSESPRALPLEAYASEMSVHHGDTLELHIRSEHPLFHLTVQQQKTSLVRIADLGEFPAVNWTIPDSAWQGCQWPITNRVVIPESWNPGAYMAHLAAGTDSTRIPFIVRNRVPGFYVSVLEKDTPMTFIGRWGFKSGGTWTSSSASDTGWARTAVLLPRRNPWSLPPGLSPEPPFPW